MAQKKVVVLDTVGPTIDVPQGADTYLMPEDVAITGALSVTSPITSTQATGTAPLVVASTTVVTNLNADLLDGNHASAFATAIQGGVADTALQSVSEDTGPQLGGNLDVNGRKIVSASNGNIDIEPNGTGNVLLGNYTFNADQTVGAGQDNYVLTYDNGTGLINLEATYNEVFTSDVATVADQDYVLWYDAPWPGTVTMVRTDCASGTCTLTGKVNTTALGGTANSVSSTATEQTHSTSNTFVKGDKLQYTISSNSACLTMAVAFYITRTG